MISYFCCFLFSVYVADGPNTSSAPSDKKVRQTKTKSNNNNDDDQAEK